MQEALLAAGARKLVYPDSGPGPITAVGNDDVAYFGEVSNAELFAASEMSAQIPELSSKTVIFDTVPWLKFRYYGKFLFIKKKPLFSNVSWQNLYDAGLVYGVEGSGPDGVPLGSVNQLRFIKKGSYTFKVRTISGDENEISTIPAGDTVMDLTFRKSMYTQLLYRVVDSVLANYPEEKFAKNTFDKIQDGVEICREAIRNTSWPNGAVLMRAPWNAVTIKIAGYTYQKGYIFTTACNWRPVLEYVPSNALFTLTDPTLEITGVLKGSVSNIQGAISMVPDENSILRLSDLTIKQVNISLPATTFAMDGVGDSNLSRVTDYTFQSKNIAYASGITPAIEDKGVDNIVRLTDVRFQTQNILYVAAVNSSVS